MKDERHTPTREKLRLALGRLQKAGHRVSIKAVAEEAGFHPSLIHHEYPDIADAIRVASGKVQHPDRGDKDSIIRALKEKIKVLRREVAELNADLAVLASINLKLGQPGEPEATEASDRVVRINSGRRKSAAPKKRGEATD